MKRYQLIVSGGTFDHFHKGHKDFLRFQLVVSERLLIGLTTDKFVSHKAYSFSAESYGLRQLNLTRFLLEQDAVERVQIAPINDPFIPPQFEKLPIEAMVVTEETKKGAEAINKRRVQKGLPKLPVVAYPLTKAQDGLPISSARVRAGTIDREGNLFIDPSLLAHDRALPVALREKLKKPFGELMDGEHFLKTPLDDTHLITVGDIVTHASYHRGLRPIVSVVDLYEKRKRRFTSLKEVGLLGDEQILSVKNYPGFISASLFRASCQVFRLVLKKRVVILVEGEEDLAVIPLLLASPLGYHVIYGQPNQGVVRILVTETIKKRTLSLTHKFKESL